MSATVQLTNVANYFKRVYSMPEKMDSMVRRHKTLSLMERDTKTLLGNEGFYVTVKTHGGFSASAKYEYAMKDQGISQSFRWFIDGPKTLYSRLSFDAITLKRAAAGGSLLDIKKQEMDDVSSGILGEIEGQLWGDGSGTIGVVSGAPGGADPTLIITLATVGDIYNVRPGMVLHFAATGGGAIKGNAYQVTSNIDLDLGTFEMTRVTSSNVAAPVSTDDILVRGNQNRTVLGIPKFIPTTAQTTSLLGYTRVGKQHDNGWRQTYTGSIEDTVRRLFAKLGRFVNREKAKYSVCVSYNDWLKLAVEQEGRIVRDPVAEQKFGTEVLSVRVPDMGSIAVIALPVLRDGRGYIIDWSSWKFYTGSALPEVIDEDGLTWRNMGAGIAAETTNVGEANATTDYLNGDGVEMRLRCLFHCVCTSPISNGTFATA